MQYSLIILIVITHFINWTVSIDKNDLESIVTPINYDISLFTDFVAFKVRNKGFFNGNVTILIQANKNESYILIHAARNIEIKSISLINKQNNLEQNITNWKFNIDVLRINLSEPLIKNKFYLLKFQNFKTNFYSSKSTGIIVLSYFNKVLQDFEHMLFTQFQPESARRAIPCFDRPGLKTEFKMKITTNRQYKILFNTIPVKCFNFVTTESDNTTSRYWKTCSYEVTPVMSTYNLAFSLVLYDPIVQYDKYNRTFRMWAHRDIYKFKWALNMTIQTLLEFETLMNISFPLNKIDSLTLPNFRYFLGMEHYGLITYTEYYLMLDPKYPLFYSKMASIALIAHEIAHQWFGNLITSATWSDLWLHEGFSTFFSYKIGFKLVTENHETEYLFKNLQILQTVRKLEDYFGNSLKSIKNDDYKTAMDRFGFSTYNKGHIVVDMVYKMLGDKKFFQVMKDYLKSNKNGLVSTQKMWSYFKNSSVKNIDQIISGWLNNKGYPIVTVESLKNNSISFDQNSSVESFPTNWYIYLKLFYGNNTFQSIVYERYLNSSSDIINLDGFSTESHWLIVNTGFINYMGVRYDDENLNKLIQNVKTDPQSISSVDKIQLLINLYDLSKKFEETNVIRILDLFSVLKNDSDPFYLKIALEYIDKLNVLFYDYDFYYDWYRYINNVLESSFDKLINDFNNNFKELNSYPILTRLNLYYISCKLNHKSCDILSNDIMQRWKTNQLHESDHDILHIALCQYISKDRTGELWNQLFNDVNFNSWDMLRMKYYGLGCTKIPWSLDKSIALAIKSAPNHVKLDQRDVFIKPHLFGLIDVSFILLNSIILNNNNALYAIIRLKKRATIRRIHYLISQGFEFPLVDSASEHLVPNYYNLNFLISQAKYTKKNQAIFKNCKMNLDWIKKNEQMISKFLKDRMIEFDL